MIFSTKKNQATVIKAHSFRSRHRGFAISNQFSIQSCVNLNMCPNDQIHLFQIQICRQFFVGLTSVSRPQTFRIFVIWRLQFCSQQLEISNFVHVHCFKEYIGERDTRERWFCSCRGRSPPILAILTWLNTKFEISSRQLQNYTPQTTEILNIWLRPANRLRTSDNRRRILMSGARRPPHNFFGQIFLQRIAEFLWVHKLVSLCLRKTWTIVYYFL